MRYSCDIRYLFSGRGKELWKDFEDWDGSTQSLISCCYESLEGRNIERDASVDRGLIYEISEGRSHSLRDICVTF